MRKIYLSIFLSLTVILRASADEAAIGVVTTIAPVHSIVSALMLGVGEPHLIIKGAGNPHSYNLHPSDAKALSKAKLVFWIGPNMEGFLEKPLENLSPNAEIIALSTLPNILLLANRTEEDDQHDHNPSDMDMHIWLSPNNAIVMATAIKNALIKNDPTNVGIFTSNHDLLLARLKQLDAEIAEQLAPVASSPYLTFHDSFQYFENHFQLNHLGAINLNPNAQIGAKKLSQLRQEISTTPPACIFMEPQYSDRIVDTINEGLDISTAMLDPLGSQLDPGPELYFQLMRGNVQNFKDCLSN